MPRRISSPDFTEKKEKGMRNGRWSLLAFFLALVLFAGLAGCKAVRQKSDQPAPRMSVEELKSRLGDPSLAVIDVRQPGDWEKSSIKITGAVREDPGNVSAWASGYPKDKTIILYCT
jgi:hypothetical protein